MTVFKGPLTSRSHGTYPADRGAQYLVVREAELQRRLKKQLHGPLMLSWGPMGRKQNLKPWDENIRDKGSTNLAHQHPLTPLAGIISLWTTWCPFEGTS